MKYYFRDLLTLLISLFILGGCDNPSKVGLDVDPGDQIQGSLIDTLAIEASTVKLDSVFTKGLAQLPLGYMNDPIIGESSASIQFALQNLSKGDSRIPLDATIDSAVMIINYGKDFFGDSLNSSTTIEVKQLSNPYEVGKNYPTNATWEVDPIIWGSKTIDKFAYTDSIDVNSVIDGKDTTVTVVPQLRVRLENEKIAELFDGNIDSAIFNDHEFYHSRVRGFQMSINKESQQGIGGIVHLAISSEGGNGLMVYYKTPDTTLQKSKFYTISPTNAAASVNHIYTAEVQEQLDNPDNSYETVYTQGIGGLRVKLSLPTISSLQDRGLIINKAELVIFTDEETAGSAFNKQAPRLTLYREDIANQRTPIPDGDTRDQIRDPRSFGLAFGGTYNSEKKQYSFILTSFIQDILLGKISNSEFYIEPAANIYADVVPYQANIYSASRAILGTHENPNYKMKLNIYYTKTID